MASQVGHEVAPREKRELTPAEERTEAGKFFSPHTDIHETESAVVVTMEVPGVSKSSIDIQLEKGVLTIKGAIDSARYASAQPLYTEYNVGNFLRRFTLPSNSRFDTDKIAARVSNGVLEVEIPKSEKALQRRIPVSSS